MEDSFIDRDVEFANGTRGQRVEVPSATHRNYFDVLSGAQAPPVSLVGKLFLPPNAKGPTPCVMIVPGSLGIADSHVRHAETLTNLGIASFVLDPFGPRSVSSTIANQTQYSFAASAFDVLAALRVLQADARLDPQRIGAQGHSRGGSAVLTAATARFAKPVVRDAPPLSAVLAAYPWSGHQFLDPRVGPTRVKVLMGDRDEWCSLQQVQGHVQAIRLTGGDASLEIFVGAAHSFDRGTAHETFAEASVAPGAPTTYMADDGSFVCLESGRPDPELNDWDTMIYAVKAGYGVRGATIGSNAGEADRFDTAMRAFWKDALKPTD